MDLNIELDKNILVGQFSIICGSYYEYLLI